MFFLFWGGWSGAWEGFVELVSWSSTRGWVGLVSFFPKQLQLMGFLILSKKQTLFQHDFQVCLPLSPFVVGMVYPIFLQKIWQNLKIPRKISPSGGFSASPGPPFDIESIWGPPDFEKRDSSFWGLWRLRSRA